MMASTTRAFFIGAGTTFAILAIGFSGASCWRKTSWNPALQSRSDRRPFRRQRASSFLLRPKQRNRPKQLLPRQPPNLRYTSTRPQRPDGAQRRLTAPDELNIEKRNLGNGNVASGWQSARSG